MLVQSFIIFGVYTNKLVTKVCMASNLIDSFDLLLKAILLHVPSGYLAYIIVLARLLYLRFIALIIGLFESLLRSQKCNGSFKIV